MLIRQKAGWRLHHQAYLWPRRTDSSPLSSVTPSLLLPRRRRSNASTGSSGTQSGSSSPPISLRSESGSSSPPISLRSESGSSSPPISLRSESDSYSPPISLRRSSSSSSAEGEELFPKVLSLWSRGSDGTAEASSSSQSCSEESSPRKRKASSETDYEPDELASVDTVELERYRDGSNSSDLPYASVHIFHKRRKHSSVSVGSSDESGQHGRSPVTTDPVDVQGRDGEDESSADGSQTR
ncbi:hypothetical protein BsWGS_13288 [Bradybaena similaris]